MKLHLRVRQSGLFVVIIFMKNLIFRFNGKSSFSQEAEDLIMRNWLPENSGTYLDIGSGLPVWGSNSFLFYRVGWRGTCVDALHRNIFLAKLFRPSDKSILALVGGVSSRVKFWEFDSYEYSTAIESQAKKVMQSERFLSGEIRLVEIKELNMVDVDSFLVPCSPEDPFFLTVDIEGYDLNLLQLIDWSNFRPRVICVEDSDSLRDKRKSEIHLFISNLGYFRVAVTPLSSVYVAEDYLNAR